MDVAIVDMPEDERRIREAAEVIVLAFAQDWPDSWPEVADGLAEVRRLMGPERICRAAIAGDAGAAGLWQCEPPTDAAAPEGRP